jgi:SAM-dependent methyltransferase
VTNADQASFVCNICDHACLVPVEALTREAPTCGRCGSSVRIRSIVHLLSRALFGRSLALRDFPQDKSILGLGLTDLSIYADPLAARLGYRNTFFHAEPRLDITELPDGLEGRHDFVIAADVLQHVRAPVQRAFDNLRRLLKPGGVLVLTLPFDPQEPTLEHFPELGQAELREEGGRRRLHNRRADGSTEVFDDLVFHGGPGFTLELRRFGLLDLLEHCRRAGFADVEVQADAVPERGIIWPKPWSRPLLARA